MNRVKGFLDKAECLFNWGTSRIDINHDIPMVVKLKEKIEEKDVIGDETSSKKWPLKLTYGYELFTEDPGEAERAVDEAIQEIETSKEYLNVEYRVSFLHIALSTKACMILKKDKNCMKDLENLIDRIIAVSKMSNKEVSGLLSMKAQIFRYYGPDGTNKSLPWLREAVRKNPEEPEWKISLVISLNRKRHFFKGNNIPWEDVEEPVNILEELLCDRRLTVKQKATSQYYLAVALHDFGLGKKPSSSTESNKRRILELCNSFYNKTDHPQYVTFAAERFAESREHNAMTILNHYLEKFPNHVGVHTTACKILRRKKDFSSAARHAQIAYENGGYGAAWLLIECKYRMGVEIDAEEYFKDLLSRFQDMYKKQTHLSATLYYIFAKQDPVNAAHHIEQAINEDPKCDNLLKPSYCYYVRIKFIPMEIAYNQIVLSLQSHHSRDDELALNSAKRRIEQVFDVKKFDISQNLVEKAFAESRPTSRGFGRRFH